MFGNHCRPPPPPTAAAAAAAVVMNNNNGSSPLNGAKGGPSPPMHHGLAPFSNSVFPTPVNYGPSTLFPYYAAFNRPDWMQLQAYAALWNHVSTGSDANQAVSISQRLAASLPPAGLPQLVASTNNSHTPPPPKPPSANLLDYHSAAGAPGNRSSDADASLSPSAAKRARWSEKSGCPLCGATPDSAEELIDHIKQERQQLEKLFDVLKQKAFNGMNGKSESAEAEEPRMSMKSRWQQYEGLKLKQKERFEGKVRLYRDRLTPTMVKVEPASLSDKGSRNTSPDYQPSDQSGVACKNCDKVCQRLKANPNCPHLLCVECVDQLVRQEPSCCPVCKTSTSFESFHSICL